MKWRSKIEEMIAAGSHRERNYYRNLKTIYEKAMENKDDPEQMRIILEDIFNQVVDYTDTEDAWYADLEEVYEFFFREVLELHLLPMDLQQIEDWVEINCHSWSEPRPETRDTFLAGLYKIYQRFNGEVIDPKEVVARFAAGEFPNRKAVWLVLVEHLVAALPKKIRKAYLGSYCFGEIGFYGAFCTSPEQYVHGRMRFLLEFCVNRGKAYCHVVDESQPALFAFPLLGGDSLSPCKSYVYHDSRWRETTDVELFAGSVPDNGLTNPSCVVIQDTGRRSGTMSFKIDISGFIQDESHPNWPDTAPVFAYNGLFEHGEPNRARHLLNGYSWSEPQKALEGRIRAGYYRVGAGVPCRGDYRILWRVDNLYHPDHGQLSLITSCDFLVRPGEILTWPKRRPNILEEGGWP